MKLVDEKGKLFGKINVIDLLVIVLVIAILAVIGLKVFGGEKNPINDTNVSAGQTDENKGSDPGEEPAKAAKLTYTVHVTAQDKEIAEQLSRFVNADTDQKAQLVASGSLLEAYLVDYWTEPSKYNREMNSTAGTSSVELFDANAAEAAGLVDLWLVIEADVDDIATNLVGRQEVRIGKSHIVKTAQLELAAGVVIDCIWEQVD